MKPSLRYALLACLALLASCGALQPQQHPQEFAAPRSDASHWQAMESQRAGDWFRLLNTGDEALAWRLRAIDSATTSIDLQTFIWELDGAGSQLWQRVLEAAGRGVRVRVLLDDSFTANIDDELLIIAEHPQVELRIFNPYVSRSDSAAARVALNLGEFWRLDHRMHNKAILVDGRVAIVGGRNLADQYFGFHEQHNFRDMEVLAGGPIAGELEREFDGYWNNPWSFPIAEVVSPEAQDSEMVELRRPPGPGPESAAQRIERWREAARLGIAGNAILLADTPPGNDLQNQRRRPDQVAQKLLTLIDSAQQELLLVTAYLVPTAPLEQAMQRAVTRGVAVRVLTNSLKSNNHLSAHAAYALHLQRLLRMGVEIHELRADAPIRERYMQAPMTEKVLGLHAKLIVVDHDRAFIGSANLDHRSLRINTEMGLVIESVELNATLRGALAPDFSDDNAWRVSLDEHGEMRWSSAGEDLAHPPGHPLMRLEDWFLGVLPIEEEM